MGDDEVFDVGIYWKSDAAEYHGPKTTFAGIEAVMEYQDRIVLVTPNGTPQHPPRIVVSRDDICGWHECNPEL